jgi:hypothetical protein
MGRPAAKAGLAHRRSSLCPPNYRDRGKSAGAFATAVAPGVAHVVPRNAEYGTPEDPYGTSWSGEEGPNPPGGMTPGPVVVCAVGPGPERWAEAGAVIASAATIAIATPLKRVLMSMVLCCRVSGALSVPHRVNAARWLASDM